MAKRKGKSVSFDAMVKFFMHNYNIPTKYDIERILDRLGQLERLVLEAHTARVKTVTAPGTGLKRSGRIRAAATAAEKVFSVIQTFADGASFVDIQRRTGYQDKKLRNIIFRLNKTGRIRRKSRGMYITA